MYYIMDWHVPLGHAAIKLQMVDNYTRSWVTGARIPASRNPPTPLRLRFHPEVRGTLLLDLYQSPAVLMSKRLIETLQNAGVDNLDTFPATITDEDTGTVYDTHAAVNIVGSVSAANLAETEFDPRVPRRRMAAAIDKLVLDEGKARQLRLFRLAENIGAIVVHEQVRDRVEQNGFESIAFEEPEDWTSF